MHSGYPVMMYHWAVQEVTDLNTIKTSGMWGPIHELGHNRQRNLWGDLLGFEMRPYTVEATCNLWAIYVHEEVLGVPVRSEGKADSDVTPDKRKKRIEQFVANGSRLEDWHMWTCLETYLQVKIINTVAMFLDSLIF